MDTQAAAMDGERRVLIVDDEITIRMALRRFFTRLGWAVEEACDGETALDLLDGEAQGSAQRFDVVVSDLRMPGVSGIELYDQLKVRNPEVVRRLIFSTGDIVSEEAATFVRSTDCVVLQKPFELSALREIVDRVVADTGR
ncbi:MAG: response regulator [Gemmatimonadaceae bacterium]